MMEQRHKIQSGVSCYKRVVVSWWREARNGPIAMASKGNQTIGASDVRISGFGMARRTELGFVQPPGSPIGPDGSGRPCTLSSAMKPGVGLSTMWPSSRSPRSQPKQPTSRKHCAESWRSAMMKGQVLQKPDRGGGAASDRI
jgi:hypothetical protein